MSYPNIISANNLDSRYSRIGSVIVTGTNSASIDTPAIQSAVTNNPGARIYVHGNIVLNATITIASDRTSLEGDGVWSVSGLSNGPMIRVQNAAYNKVGFGIFFDPSWTNGVIAIELLGALLGEFHVTGDRIPVAMNLDCASSTATQQTAQNDLYVVVRNGIRALVFTGKNARECTLNRVRKISWWAAASVSCTAIDFAAYCDNNILENGYILLTASGHIGIIYNSQNPTGDVQVYENHVLTGFVLETQVTGTIGVQGNRTWGTVGTYPTLVSFRLSGGSTPALNIASNCDIRYVNANLNGQLRNS